MLVSTHLTPFNLIDKLVETVSSSLINGEGHFLKKYQALVQSLNLTERKLYLHSLLRVLSKRHLSSNESNGFTGDGTANNQILGGVAALISGFVEGSIRLKDALVEWLVGTTADVGLGHRTQRAVIAAISIDRGEYFM